MKKINVVKLDDEISSLKYHSLNASGVDLQISKFKTLFFAEYFNDAWCETQEDISDMDQISLGPGERVLIKTGFKMEIPNNYELQVRPRSGMALNSGITVLNSPGTVDADYRGEIGVILINHGLVNAKLRLGDRVAQGVISKILQVEYNEVPALNVTARGEDGFGSTGLN